ncbi:Uncharacterized protein At5g41620 [Linum perenne]
MADTKPHMAEKEKGVKNKGKKHNPEPESSVEEERAQLDRSSSIQRNIRVLLVGKRKPPSTPSPHWRLDFDSENPVREFANCGGGGDSVSARKLCASLWEIQPKLELSASEIGMNSGHGSRRSKKLERVSEIPASDQPANAGTSQMLRRQHYESLKQNDRYMSRLSPARSPSSSSLEVAPYKHPVAPSGVKGKPSHGPKPSTELLKVLNRIWSLEEQQSMNMSVMKALKMELDHSQSQIKGLLKEKGTNRRQVDSFMEHVSEDKVPRKHKQEEGRIKATIQSVKEELHDERRLRIRSESLHRKLAQELSEVKTRFSNAVKELEREMNARLVMESLCDEFAMGIKDYEEEIRTMRHKLDIGRETPDRPILHISEAWLDERLQMKLSSEPERRTVVDKLSTEIESYLRASRDARLQKESESRRESFPLNEAGSAPRGRNGDLDSSTDTESAHHNLTNPVRLGRRGTEAFISSMVRDHSLSSEGDRIHPVECHTDHQPAICRGAASPVKRWSSKLPSLNSEEPPESSSRREGSTLKEKLMEARLEGQKSRSKGSLLD